MKTFVFATYFVCFLVGSILSAPALAWQLAKNYTSEWEEKNVPR